MPIKREESNKRYYSSDSDESVYTVTPKKSSLKRLNTSEDSDQMVNTSNNIDIRLTNGRVNGIAMDSTNLMNSMNHGMSPVVSLNRNAVDNYNRKSLGLVSTPKATPIQEKDENHERRQRMNERIKAQRKSLAVGHGLTPGRRSGVAPVLVSMTSDQLKEMYSKCIHMAANNKINAKNAFGLHLIDYMSDVIKEKVNGSVNFKMAGSALDAGAKIYCHRVDSVHTEAQKVASSLVMALDSKSGNQESDQNNAHNNVMDAENENEINEENVKTKKKKLRRNVKTLAQNIESLNGKVETSVEIDPVFHHLSSAFDIGNVNSLLMANLKRDPSGMMLLDPNASLNFDNYPPCNHSNQSISNFFKDLEGIKRSSAKICPTHISSFEFLNRDCGIDFIPREEDPAFKTDNFAFDLDASVEDIDDIDCGDGGQDLLSDPTNEDMMSDDGAHEVPQTINKSIFRAVNMVGVGDLVKMLSDKPNDYTYFNPKLMSTWAGPQHWKRIPFWHKKNRIDGENVKTRRERRKYLERDYLKDEINDDKNEKTGSSELKLKVSTLERWQNNHLELKLPDDRGFDPKDLARSFIKPESTFQCAKSHESVLDTTINTNNSFDAQNSPGMDRYDDDDDDMDMNTAGFTDPLDIGQSAPVSLLNPNTGDTFPFVGDNLVEQPYDVQNYNIAFAKFAKKMDVKKLKKAMLEVIISDQFQPSTPIRSQDLNPCTQHTINFSDLYQNLPNKITPMMANNLSPPIAFVTLLHLANEKNLKLIGQSDLEDFTIEQFVN